MRVILCLLLLFVCITFVHTQYVIPTYSDFKGCVMSCQNPCTGQDCTQNQDHEFINCYSSSEECHNWNSEYFNSLNTKTLDLQLFKMCFDKCKPHEKDSIFSKMYNCWRKCALGDEKS